MRPTIQLREKYAQPEVVDCWQNLSRQGLQKCEWEMVARYFPPPEAGPLLDVGCGAGRAGLALGEQGYRVSGVDLSLPMLLAGRRLSAGARLAAANVLALPVAGDSFAAAFMFFGALQHVPGRDNRRRALAEMARAVRPGGHLVLGLDNLAPALSCYAYWFKEKLFPSSPPPARTGLEPSTAADATLWQRQAPPLIWHARGLARTLRWRTWAGLVDLARRLRPRAGGPEPGDALVAQFSLRTTPGRIYYHLYRPAELVEDAAAAGWRPLGMHSGRELNEGRVYPPAIRGQDKQLFFAFEKG